jgi:hypothetical protein
MSYRTGDRVSWKGKDLYILDVWDEDAKIYMVGEYGPPGVIGGDIAHGLAPEDELEPLVDIESARKKERLREVMDNMDKTINDYLKGKLKDRNFVNQMDSWISKFKEINNI